MRVTRSVTLPCSAERALQEVQTTRLLQHVSAPLLTFTPVRPATLPNTWTTGEYLVRLRLFGVVPLGHQWIVPSRAAPNALRDVGRGTLTRAWDHVITVTSLPDGRARYTDDIRFRAGLLTPVVLAFTYLLYAHRQRRWLALARKGFTYDE